MCNVCNITEWLIVVVDRGDERDVVEVTTATIGIVDQECVAGADVFDPVVDDSFRN